jgi:serine/threonine-protein kinase
MAAPRHVDRHTFLANLRQSGLLTDTQLGEVTGRFPEITRGRVIARVLVEEGLLTRYQAEQLLAGRTNGFLLGEYRILEQLGEGGMGRVFKAEHRTLSRHVALKVLAPRLLQTARAQKMFLREVRAAARLLHPNIVTAFDASHAGGRAYLVMEFVEGPNLDQLVRYQGALPIGQACEFVRQVAEGLQHAHLRGMVHRDIKPANLLWQRPEPGAAGAGMVKISDFGLARLHAPGSEEAEETGTLVTRGNAILGTPDYIAPEQARDLHRADIRSDLYSLGCTLYFLLTGQPPFPGGSSLEKLVRHAVEDAAPIEKLRPEVPHPIAAMVRRLMAKDPALRFQTPADLSAALRPYCEVAAMTWEVPVPTAGYRDQLATPSGASNGPCEDVGPATDEGSALAGTVMAAPSTTPMASGTLSPLAAVVPSARRGISARWAAGLILAGALASGLLAAAATWWIAGR